jgi:hypothetical protein
VFDLCNNVGDIFSVSVDLGWFTICACSSLSSISGSPFAPFVQFGVDYPAE